MIASYHQTSVRGGLVTKVEPSSQRQRGMSDMAKRFIGPMLQAAIPFPVWRLLSQVALLVPYYHMVSDADVPHVRHLYRFRTIREFAADLDFLLHHFAPIELQDVIDSLAGRRSLPTRCFHLTFDDGFREMYEIVAPVLRKKGVPATFFLNTGFLDQGGMAHHNKISLILDRLERPISNTARREIETVLPPESESKQTLKSRLLSIRYADRRMVDRIAEVTGVDIDQYIRTRRPYLSSEETFSLLGLGFTIGAHSVDHPLYRDLSFDEQMRQTRASVDFIVNKFGPSTRAFAFPHTDAGVSTEFFDWVFTAGVADVCFGTQGLVGHYHPRNVERFSMEKTIDPANMIIARQFMRAVFRRLV